MVLFFSSQRRPAGLPGFTYEIRGAESEFQIHSAIVVAWRKFARRDWLLWHTPNGERREQRTAAKLRAMGTLPGVPDLLLLGPDGRLRCIEVKGASGRLSDGQNEFRAFCIARGIPFAVVCSLADALAILSEWGYLRVRISGGAA